MLSATRFAPRKASPPECRSARSPRDAGAVRTWGVPSFSSPAPQWELEVPRLTGGFESLNARIHYPARRNRTSTSLPGRPSRRVAAPGRGRAADRQRRQPRFQAMFVKVDLS